MLHRISGITETILEKFIGILCLVLLTCLFVEVMNRYVFGISWPEIQFIIPFCFLWMCMIGSAVAVRKHQHFEVDLLVKLFKGNALKVHTFLMRLSVFAGGAIIAWSSIAFLELGLLKKSPATGIPMIYIYASILVGGLLISLMALDRMAQHQLVDIDGEDAQ